MTDTPQPGAQPVETAAPVAAAPGIAVDAASGTPLGTPPRTVWINAGELSGDMHGGRLLEALRRRDPALRCIGMGGPHLREAGQDAILRVEDLSVMGITEVLGYLPRILGMLRRIKAELAARRPDAVVLIDAPEFNFRIAKAAHALGIPVHYYISPKIWAWRTGRVNFIRRHIRRMICILPFEVEFYRRHGMDVDYVGNPLLDMMDWQRLDAIVPVPGRIGLMPGSRRKEIEALMPEYGKAARLLLESRPGLSFHCVRAPNVTEDALRALWPADVPLTIESPDDRYATLRTCQLLLAASGTATLETALLGVPTLVAYRVSPFSYWLGKRLVKVKWVSLPNLVLNREVFPELLQENADGAVLAHHALRWLGTPGELDRVRADLADLRRRCGPPGAADAAARIILEEMK